MRKTFIVSIATFGLLASGAAWAQPSGAPANERDSTGQPADAGTLNANPARPGGAPSGGNTVVVPGTAGQGGATMPGRAAPQPGGISPLAPPQGGASGEDTRPGQR